MVRAVIFILCLSPAVARAGTLYINGVRVDGLSNVKLHNVDFEIDDKGDLHVTAKGYTVNVAETNPPKPAPPARTSAGANTNAEGSANANPRSSVRASVPAPRYVLSMSESGDPQWDVDLYVNGQFVRRFQSGQAPGPIDVTRLIKPGDNAIRFRAVKQEGQVRSVQPSEYLQITVDAETQLATGAHEHTRIYSYRRTAAETGLFDDSISISTR
jgi:hypothetical protein